MLVLLGICLGLADPDPTLMLPHHEVWNESKTPWIYASANFFTLSYGSHLQGDREGSKLENWTGLSGAALAVAGLYLAGETRTGAPAYALAGTGLGLFAFSEIYGLFRPFFYRPHPRPVLHGQYSRFPMVAMLTREGLRPDAPATAHPQ